MSHTTMNCEQCQATLRFPTQQIGRIGKCPRCKTSLRLCAADDVALTEQSEQALQKIARMSGQHGWQLQVAACLEDQRYNVRSELELLPNRLKPDETIALLAKGVVGRHPGLIAATNDRLIFLTTKLIRSIPLTELKTIAAKVGPISGELEVTTATGELSIKRIMPSQRAKDLATYALSNLYGAPAESAASAPAHS